MFPIFFGTFSNVMTRSLWLKPSYWDQTFLVTTGTAVTIFLQPWGCADPNFPGVYARVTEDLAWIKENTSGKQCQGTRKLFTRLLNKFDLSEED